MIGQVLWGVWATDKLLTLEKREVATVQLEPDQFHRAEARAGRPPEETKVARAGLPQGCGSLGSSWAARAGRSSLPAVVAGARRTLTQSVRQMLWRRMGATLMLPADRLIRSASAPSVLWGGLGAGALALSARRLRFRATPRSPGAPACPTGPFWCGAAVHRGGYHPIRSARFVVAGEAFRGGVRLLGG